MCDTVDCQHQKEIKGRETGDDVADRMTLPRHHHASDRENLLLTDIAADNSNRISTLIRSYSRERGNP